MDNHPIPQDVTGFQFKLIGNMTIKQFGYVAAGVVIAWALYYSPGSFFIKFPLAIFFAATGFALAFVPVEGRPLDAMIINFFKALFYPNQYIFQKENAPFLQIAAHPKVLAPQAVHETTKTQDLRQLLLSQALQPAKNKLDEIETAYLRQIITAMTPQVAPIPVSAATPALPVAVATPQPQIVIDTPPPPPIQEKRQESPNEYEQITKELELTKQQNQQLEQELANLLQKLTLQKEQPATVVAPPAQVLVTPAVTLGSNAPITKKVPAASLKKNPTLPVPDVPNIVIGIVKDPRGNVLSNILVEIKDKDSSPVRAFKTNAFGQFASATPLLNGVYTLEFDDPQEKQKFDAIELTVNGTIISPIEVTSNDQREELRKSLFSNN